MKKMLILCWPLLLVGGCAVFDKVIGQAETIESVGELAGQIGTGLAITAPQLGLIVLTAGGLIIAIGKMLKVFKEK